VRRLKTVAILGRETGLAVLRDALIGNPLVELDTVFTHGRLPKGEGGGERPELAAFREACDRAGVRLSTLDLPAARRLEEFLPAEPFDLLVSLSWRALVSPAGLARARVGTVNLHRGALPAYRGAAPLRRAIEAGERRVAITAHGMVEEVDAGPVLATVWMDIEAPPAGTTAVAHASTVKARLVPLYAPLARLAIASVAASAA
jgi:methionyl-tRNA formyltransferase